MNTAPTDSVLRRHYEQMREAACPVPTDSVLRRHYEQMREAARSGVTEARAPEPAALAPEPPIASRPAAAPEPAPGRSVPEPAASGQSGGFFGWLKRLFGG